MSEWTPKIIELRPTIMIVEDDVVLANLIAKQLRRNGFIPLVANTAGEARRIAAEKTAALYILDVSLPDGDGFSLCGELRRRSDAPVLFLTGKSETNDKISGLGAGGDYYLTKPYEAQELLAVIRSLLRRERRFREIASGASVINKGSLTLKLDERKAYVDGLDAGLSPKEFTILLILVQNEDHEMTSERLYEDVWNAPMINNSGAVRVHISNLKKKLDEENAEDFSIYNEPGKGYIFTMT